MTTLNAFGFFLLGLVMIFVPILLPDYFAANAADGSNTSALWLAVMGIFQGSMSCFYIVRNEAVPLAVRLMMLRLPTFKSMGRRISPALMLRPAANSYLGGRNDNGQRMAA